MKTKAELTHVVDRDLTDDAPVGRRTEPQGGKARTVPDGASGKAARILGNGEGMQKLCYVLFLSHYDDELAFKLADMGAFLSVARSLTKDGGKAESIEEKLLLSKAARLESVLCQDEIDLAIVRAGMENKEPS